MLSPDGYQDAVKRLPDCILPVMDLMRGQVVHAVAGQRQNYQPLKNCRVDRADDPLRLTSAFLERWGIDEFYVADLDALQGQGSQEEVIEQLLSKGFQLWLDAGVHSAGAAQRLLDRGIAQVIVASETMRSMASVKELMEWIDPRQVVVSLDLRAGQVQAADVRLAQLTPLEFVEKVVQLGIQQLIILDVARVGTSSGPATLGLCERVKAEHPEMTLISGGGVRHMDDVDAYVAAGVQRVLASTWLHALP